MTREEAPRLGPQTRLEELKGEDLKLLFRAGTRWLAANAGAINALNVFPVPDGDTGTNMLLTMQVACREAEGCRSAAIGEVLKALSKGALMGARGNSGVILSQFLRGMTEVLDGQTTLDAPSLAQAFQQGTQAAYKGVMEPVEGTILTVAREATQAAAAVCQETSSFQVILAEIVRSSREAVARTPQQLAQLARAGVVDAGGQGFAVLFEGMLRHLQGESLQVEFAPEGARDVPRVEEGGQYGYDVQFLLEGPGLKLEAIRAQISSLGESVLVVGDDKLIKVHIHTTQPGRVMDYALSQGKVRDATVENLQEQYEEFLASSAKPPIGAEEVSDIGIVAVLPGAGLRRLAESLGVSAVVAGGQTMNPSTAEILEAVERVPADNILILPNNKNVLLTAKQAQGLTRKRVLVVPTRTIPQGIGALFAFNYQSGLATNAKAMAEAAKKVQTGEITTSVREVIIDGTKIAKGEIIGLVNGQLIAHGSDMEAVAQEVLDCMQADEFEIITLYYGDGMEGARAERMLHMVRRSYPEQEVELINGGQPHYHFIFAAE